MIRVRQNNIGGRGNCMAACWASIVECDINEVPDYRALEAIGEPWLNHVNAWLSKHHGFVYLELDHHFTRHITPRGYHLINGDSHGGAGGHSMVGYNGAPIWDPAGGKGISRVDDYGVLVALNDSLRATWQPTWAECLCGMCIRGEF